jgi:hypothetical protein
VHFEHEVLVRVDVALLGGLLTRAQFGVLVRDDHHLGLGFAAVDARQGFRRTRF